MRHQESLSSERYHRAQILHQHRVSTYDTTQLHAKFSVLEQRLSQLEAEKELLKQQQLQQQREQQPEERQPHHQQQEQQQNESQQLQQGQVSPARSRAQGSGFVLKNQRSPSRVQQIFEASPAEAKPRTHPKPQPAQSHRESARRMTSSDLKNLQNPGVQQQFSREFHYVDEEEFETQPPMPEHAQPASGAYRGNMPINFGARGRGQPAAAGKMPADDDLQSVAPYDPAYDEYLARKQQEEAEEGEAGDVIATRPPAQAVASSEDAGDTQYAVHSQVDSVVAVNELHNQPSLQPPSPVTEVNFNRRLAPQPWQADPNAAYYAPIPGPQYAPQQPPLVNGAAPSQPVPQPAYQLPPRMPFQQYQEAQMRAHQAYYQTHTDQAKFNEPSEIQAQVPAVQEARPVEQHPRHAQPTTHAHSPRQHSPHTQTANMQPGYILTTHVPPEVVDHRNRKPPTSKASTANKGFRSAPDLTDKQPGVDYIELNRRALREEVKSAATYGKMYHQKRDPKKEPNAMRRKKSETAASTKRIA